MTVDTRVVYSDEGKAVPDLASYDAILINTSGGKDSQAMMDYVVELARSATPGVAISAVHCDLGRVEWPGTRELVERQCAHYGIPLRIVARPQGDLLHQIEFERKKFPDGPRRFCTSDQKTGQVRPLLTAMGAALRAEGRKVPRILSCLGMRAAESPRRAGLDPLEVERSNRNVHIDRWLPIHGWTDAEVWARIAASGVDHHPAYDAGMPRLSCSFCILASKPALVRAAQLRPDLAAEYAGIEQRIGFRFKDNLSMADIIAAAAEAPVDAPIPTWEA